MSLFDHFLKLLFARKSPAARPEPVSGPDPDPIPDPESIRAAARPIEEDTDFAPAPQPLAPPPPVAPEPPPVPVPAIGKTVAGSIRLGSVDADVPDSAWTTFVGALQKISRVHLDQIAAGLDKISLNRLAPAPTDVLTVAHLQDALKTLGFYRGGEIDGICGYRTSAAIRLFQEYVRTMEGKAGFKPDGQFGPASNAELQRWLTRGVQSDWQARPGEYDRWFSLLGRVKAKAEATPTPVMQAVNAFDGTSDTRKVQDWDFTADNRIHLIGVRRSEYVKRFDDIFVLLMNGLVFKFQGSTEPGASNNPKGPPYIVPGQHEYHFGWHRKSYQALRPLNQGVLVIRGGANFQLDETDLNKGLEANATINIHWAGKGLGRFISSWSEGCQVITGDLYINPRGDLVDCSSFTAVNNGAYNQNASQTRGAYTLLSDLIATYSGEAQTNTVLYTMIGEEDLDLDPEIKADLLGARDAVYERST